MTELRTLSLTKADYEALAAFRRALRQFTAFSELAARRAGLTPQQHQALLTIKAAPGADTLIIGDLAQALMIRPHSAVELVDRLVQLGLAERREDPADHRRVRIALTPRADSILSEMSTAHFKESCCPVAGDPTGTARPVAPVRCAAQAMLGRPG
jgi:DNA-binding MarR family transcriptional regulator